MSKVSCDNCDIEFEKLDFQIRNTSHNYCCLECSRLGKTKFNTVNLFCEYCDKEYVRCKAIAKRSNFCSKICMDNSRIINYLCVDCSCKVSNDDSRCLWSRRRV